MCKQVQWGSEKRESLSDAMGSTSILCGLGQSDIRSRRLITATATGNVVNVVRCDNITLPAALQSVDSSPPPLLLAVHLDPSYPTSP